MKPAIVLLLSTDPTAENLAREAVTTTRHGLRVVHTAPEAFHLLETDCQDVDLAIIDLDPGMHGNALLEAVGDRIPVIALTSLEASYMDAVASRHGAKKCLAKPFRIEDLQAALEQVLRERTGPRR